jgi:RNA polymerase sigma-70 factor, ECF subfamily
MDSPRAGHTLGMTAASANLHDFAPASAGADAGEMRRAVPHEVPSFDAVYEECLDFVWRSLRSLGIQEQALDDAVQDVFVVVHRRLAEFEARSTVRTWVFGIAIRVARDHRRREQRKGGLEPLDVELVDLAPGPYEHAAHTEALRELATVLDALDDDKREVFVLSELEQLSAPEIAEALGLNINTVYSRIRAARLEFKVVLEQHATQGGNR